MTEEMKDADFQKKLAWVTEHCADRREWEGVRIGNLSREDAVFLFGESVVAGLDKKPCSVNCPLSSDESYTDPDARHEENPDLEFYESIVCKDKRGRRLGTLIHVRGDSRPHYLFDRVEKAHAGAEDQKGLAGDSQQQFHHFAGNPGKRTARQTVEKATQEPEGAVK